MIIMNVYKRANLPSHSTQQNKSFLNKQLSQKYLAFWFCVISLIYKHLSPYNPYHKYHGSILYIRMKKNKRILNLEVITFYRITCLPQDWIPSTNVLYKLSSRVFSFKVKNIYKTFLIVTARSILSSITFSNRFLEVFHSEGQLRLPICQYYICFKVTFLAYPGTQNH